MYAQICFLIQAPLQSLQQALELSLSSFFIIDDLPKVLRHQDDPKTVDNVYAELAKSMIGQSEYTFASLFFALLVETHGFIPDARLAGYAEQTEALRKQLLAFLGDTGVLFYPTYPVASLQHNESFVRIFGVMYTMLFNVLGFPATHVPMGRDLSGKPVGMQVIAAPHQDRLCLCIAGELEAAFGGWVKPF